MSKTEKPSIRFHGFDDTWEQRKAKELFVSTADKGYPELPVLSATQDRGMIRRDENSINIFHDKKNEAGYKRVLPGQFVIHLRSFQGGFAHSAIEGITSPAYTVFGFSEPEKHDSEYWKYVFTSKSFIQRLETVTYGIRDGRSISYEEFLTLGFVYPSKAEQTAIARYLDKLSDLITLHQRKFEKLTNVKKSMLEKMFPQNGSCYPAVRFKGFTGPWERRKFGDVFEEYSEKNRADLPPLTIIQGSGTIRRDESERALQYDKASLSNYKVVNEGDLIVHLRSFEGGLEKANSQGIISPAYHTFHGEGVDSRFYYTYFRSKNFIDTDLKPHVYGIRDGRSIDIEGMKTIEIPFTSYPEQKLIGDAIDSINTLISLQRRELEKLQSIKKALLEKMFV